MMSNLGVAAAMELEAPIADAPSAKGLSAGNYDRDMFTDSEPITTFEGDSDFAQWRIDNHVDD